MKLSFMAERGRFELPIPLRVCRISSAVHSTTLPPLREMRRRAPCGWRVDSMRIFLSQAVEASALMWAKNTLDTVEQPAAATKSPMREGPNRLTLRPLACSTPALARSLRIPRFFRWKKPKPSRKRQILRQLSKRRPFAEFPWAETLEHGK